MPDALMLRWEEGDAKGYTDVIPTSWLRSSKTARDARHKVLDPRGNAHTARCRVSGSENTLILDYGGVHADYNEARRFRIGLMKIVVGEASTNVFWKSPRERAYTKASVTVWRTDATEQKAFLLTWKESGWPKSNIVRMCEVFGRLGYVDEEWTIHAHRQAKIGDRVWLLRQGRGPKVIFGKGTIIGSARLGDNSRGKKAMQVPVRFSAFTDPDVESLVSEAQVRAILTARKIRAQASGDTLSSEESAALERLIKSGPGTTRVIEPDQGDDAPFNPENVADARKRIQTTIAQRRGQSAFRRSLLDAYDGRCAISGCDVIDVLEAAHIFPYRGEETNKVSNGLLLRADLHTLFDCYLIEIDPETRAVRVSSDILATEYGKLNGTALRAPKTISHAPSRAALLSRQNEISKVRRTRE